MFWICSASSPSQPLRFGLWLQESSCHGLQIAVDSSCGSRHLLFYLSIQSPATVIKIQYVASHLRHSYADVIKFHLHFHSLDFALPSSLGFQHQLPKFNSACRSCQAHIRVDVTKFHLRFHLLDFRCLVFHLPIGSSAA